MGLQIHRTVEHRPESRIDEALGVLKQRFGDRLSTAESVRDQHGKGEDHHPVVPPDGVFFAESTEEVAEAVKICAEYKMPVIPFGTGTSLEGHVAALNGGLTIDLTRMNEVLQVNPEDLDCRVQPGVTRKQLNEYLRDTGLFFPIDPGADASIGGMTATRASGTNAVRYGTMRENVLGLTVVTADGRIIKTAQRARKSSAGYDLTRLFVGSEGTLGVITEITLRLYGIPESIVSALCAYPSLEAAVNTVIETIQIGIPVSRIEIADEIQMKAINDYSGTDLPVAPMLWFEFHGTEAGTTEQAEMVKAISDEWGGGEFEWTASPEERAKLWQARHDAAYAAKNIRKGAEVWATDVCVPISRLAEWHRRDPEGHRRERSDRPHRRPCRRRQLPSGPDRRPGRRGRDGPGQRRQRTPGPPRHRHGRHLHRRTRHRHGQDGLPDRRAWRGGFAHAPDQEGPRPGEHHEPGQDFAGVIFAGLRERFCEPVRSAAGEDSSWPDGC